MSVIIRLLFLALLPAAAVINAAEFEVLDKFTVDGYSLLIGSADIRSNNFTVGSSAFVVKNGNVGIGTTAPTTKLEVNGNVNAANFSSATDYVFSNGCYLTSRSGVTACSGPEVNIYCGSNKCICAYCSP